MYPKAKIAYYGSVCTMVSVDHRPLNNQLNMGKINNNTASVSSPPSSQADDAPRNGLLDRFDFESSTPKKTGELGTLISREDEPGEDEEALLTSLSPRQPYFDPQKVAMLRSSLNGQPIDQIPPKPVTSCPREGIGLNGFQLTSSGRNKGLGKANEPKFDCQVCGDVAAGFHCGAYICEACKVRE